MSFGGNPRNKSANYNYVQKAPKQTSLLSYVPKKQQNNDTTSSLNTDNNKIQKTELGQGSTTNDKPILFTIGYGGHTSDKTFFEILKNNQIDILVDVRISPFSNFSDFTGKNLQNTCKKNKIVYEHFQELGNIFHNLPDKDERVVKYEQLIKQSGDLLGVRLTPLLKNSGKRVCIMCGCKNVKDCHRGKISECYYKEVLGFPLHHL